MIDPASEEALVEKMGKFSRDPEAFVRFAFDWGHGELEGYDGPDDWQSDVLKEIRDGLKTPSAVIQEAVASGHDIGKSALVSWIILWAISTFSDTRGIVTANTDGQLRNKTWPELSKWYRLCVTKHWFTVTATSIYSIHPEHEKTWRVDIIPWSVNRPEAFAGLHNKGRRVLIVFDEASAIDDKIWEITEGAAFDDETEIVWCAFGNPTRNTGRFHACFHNLSHRWKTRQIDSRKCKLTNKKTIQNLIEDYGEDSDIVRVRVKGEFPRSSEHQFIPSDVIAAARGKHLRPDQFDFAPKIIFLDNAWTGGDEIVIGMRQGLGYRQLAAFKINDDDMKIAGHLARLEDENKADAVFIDLGYGTGVASAGKAMGRKWVLIAFGGSSADVQYVNKRAECWGKARQWLKEGGAIPDDPMLAEELSWPEGYEVATGKNCGKIIIESKDDMKKRGLRSPNRADALVGTFALPVRAINSTITAGRIGKEFARNPRGEMANTAKRDRLAY